MTIQKSTLDSGIEVGPKFVNFAFFPGPTYCLIKERENTFCICKYLFKALSTFILFAKLSRPYVCSLHET